jgi:hypothetical protein
MKSYLKPEEVAEMAASLLKAKSIRSFLKWITVVTLK